MATRRGLDGRFISKVQSENKPYMVIDSIGRKQHFFNGVRIKDRVWQEFKTESKNKGKGLEPDIPGDPGEITESGHYRYDGELWSASDGETIREITPLDTSELVGKNERGAEHGSHIKEFEIAHFDSVDSIYDAAFFVASDPRLQIDPSQVIIKSIKWNPVYEEYDVEYLVDFSSAYGED